MSFESEIIPLTCVKSGGNAINSKPVIIGIYGLPGAGKSYLLNELRQLPSTGKFLFYEGSKVIDTTCPGGLDAFQRLDAEDQKNWRERAIDKIAKDCHSSASAAVVVGHYMFWDQEAEASQPVITQSDLNNFTHILYLKVPAEVIARRRTGDDLRVRKSVSLSHLQKWQRQEIDQLRGLCLHHGILFMTISPHGNLLNRVSSLLDDFKRHDECKNLAQAEAMLDDILGPDKDEVQTVLLMDADKTLAEEDAASLFWRAFAAKSEQQDKLLTLKELFSSQMGYSYAAFRQATLLYEEATTEEEFDVICREIASSVYLRTELSELMRLSNQHKHIKSIVVTCGLKYAWEAILEKEGLSQTVKVIGGGRMADGFVVTPAVKGALVHRLQKVYNIYVCAFGDSPLDLDMLSVSDKGIVVVGDQKNRSKSMDAALASAIAHRGLRLNQAIVSGHHAPRLNLTQLPTIKLDSRDFLEFICQRQPESLQISHATDKAASKMLMTPMRNSEVFGPALRDVHGRVGQYLATDIISELIGIEEVSIPHVQGHKTAGFRLRDELGTTIVALMRGGEPMAFGVSDVFPQAMFVHAQNPGDVALHHLEKQQTVILVDSVINSGQSMLEFVNHIRSLHATIRIVLVAGVVQEQAITRGSFFRALVRSSGIALVSLRLSKNKFTGTKTTDTGNRLFNTTHLI